jgi:hypothetical protein
VAELGLLGGGAEVDHLAVAAWILHGGSRGQRVGGRRGREEARFAGRRQWGRGGKRAEGPGAAGGGGGVGLRWVEEIEWREKGKGGRKRG